MRGSCEAGAGPREGKMASLGLQGHASAPGSNNCRAGVALLPVELPSSVSIAWKFLRHKKVHLSHEISLANLRHDFYSNC